MARRTLAVSTVLLLAIAALLVMQWPDRSLWYDETVNAYFAGERWTAIWEWCTAIDNQVPLHFAALKVWGMGLGTGEFALRAFSFFCALLGVAGLIALGQRVAGRESAGWLAAAALALSQSFLYAAFEVRAYGLALALFAVSSVALWSLWERYADGTRPLDRGYAARLALYLGLALGLVYTHYTGFIALAAHGVYLVWRTLLAASRRRATLLAHLGLGLALGYVPWIVALAGRDIRAGTAYAGHIPPDAALRTYVDFFAYGQQLLPEGSFPYAGAIAGLAIACGAAWMIARRRDPAGLRGAALAASVALVPLAGLVVMVYAVQAKLSGRHGWPVWLGAALVIGLGLAAFEPRRWLRWPVWIAALALVWLPSRAALRPVYDSHLREAFAYINENAEDGDVLVLRDGTLFTAAEYYGAALPWIGLPPDKLTDVERTLFFDEAAADLQALVTREDARRVWVVAWQGHIMDPQDLVAGILEMIGDPQPIGRPFGDVFVSMYTLRAEPRALAEHVAEMRPIVQTPPDGPIYLGGYVVEPGPVMRGGIIHVHTWWQRGDTVMPDMRVSVRLYNARGTFYTQHDQPPVAPWFGQEHWQPGSPVLSRFTLWIPAEIPADTLDARMLLYDMQGSFEPIPVEIGSIEVLE
jgi:hypothetical protein